MTTKKRKKGGIKFKGFVRITIIVATLALLIVKMIQWNSQASDITYYLTQGEIRVSDQYKGVIIRDEELVASPFAGQITQVANDGVKVKKNERVMEITRGAESLETDTGSVDLTTLPLQVTKEELSFEIATIKEDIAQAIKAEKYDEVPAMSTTLSLKIERLKAIEVPVDLPNLGVDLGDEGVSLGEKKQVLASKPGIITYYVDGYEEVFTYKRVANLQFENIIDLDIVPDLAQAYEVNQGDVLYKIIDANKYYLVVVADKSKYSQYNLYHEVDIETGQQTVTGTIEKFFDAGDQVAIAIELSTYIKDFHKLRFVDVTIRQEAYQGLKVRSSSVTRHNNQLGVYVVDKLGTVMFKPIQVIYNEGDSVIVKSDIFYLLDKGSNKPIETVSLYDKVIRIADDYKIGDKIK